MSLKRSTGAIRLREYWHIDKFQTYHSLLLSGRACKVYYNGGMAAHVTVSRDLILYIYNATFLLSSSDSDAVIN